MQTEAWPKGLDSIHKLPPREKKAILAMSPFVDPTDQLIKGGGRLDQSDLTFGRKHPTLIPDTTLGDALIGYIHSVMPHQGRKITSASVREYGFSAVGGKRRISRIISACLQCRTLRTPLMQQKLAALQKQR